MRAIRNDVIVQIIEQDTQTQSGLIIQGYDHSQQQRVRVIACGEQVSDIQAGDVVIIDQHTRARQFTLSGQKYWIVRADEIIAVYQ